MKHHTDFLVIGSGIAALSFSLRIAKYFKDATVTIITKESKSESNTKYAQGGTRIPQYPKHSGRLVIFPS